MASPQHLRPIPDALRQPIGTEEEARAWIAALLRDGRDFHFDDRADDVIDGRTGDRIFSALDAALISERLSEIYALECWTGDLCPMAVLLELTEAQDAMLASAYTAPRYMAVDCETFAQYAEINARHGGKPFRLRAMVPALRSLAFVAGTMGRDPEPYDLMLINPQGRLDGYRSETDFTDFFVLAES